MLLKTGVKNSTDTIVPQIFPHPRLSFRRDVEFPLSGVAQRIVGDAKTAGDETCHGRNVTADSRITERHETKANARSDQTQHVDDVYAPAC